MWRLILAVSAAAGLVLNGPAVSVDHDPSDPSPSSSGRWTGTSPLWQREGLSIEDIAQGLIEAEIGRQPPAIRLQPPNPVINFPLTASTRPRPPLYAELPDPYVGVVMTTPEYRWVFGSPPLDGGTSLAHLPISHVAHVAQAPPTPTVRLTVTWKVILIVSGRAPVRLRDVARSASIST